MPRAVTRVAHRDVSVGSDQVGGLGDRLSSGIGSGGLGLGHTEMLRRKRSLDNLENIPPFGLDGGALSAGDKPAVSLLDLTAAQHSQSQRKQRRTVITASSPGGHQRMATNPRRATVHSDSVSQHSGSITPCSSQTRPRQTPAMRTPLGASGSSSGSGSSRLRRLPKRNLKPLDFSGLHGPKTQAGGATAVATTSATAASSRPGGHAPILALPVSPAQSSPLEHKTQQRTPPSTGARQQTAFAGVLASAYQRAAGRRVSQRTLRFEGTSEADLQESDPVLGPRCPVIGAPRGVFGEAAAESSQGRAAARQAQAAFEVAVAEQSTARGRSGRRAGRPAGRGRSRRAVSECKYCGKQYKYHSKLASHEQHCASRLEALLYSADESEQHVIHCVCGPRHGRAAGARDEQAMVQCDGCLCWLHISCVGVDENNLPAEFFCSRCTPADDDAAPATPRRNFARAAGSVMSPESHRLAALLAHVPDNDGSETEEEPMSLRLKGRARRGRGVVQAAAAAEGSSEDTMSISDVAEVARFHRQGSTVRACRSPVAPRMAQSETNVSPAPTPRRRRVRAGASTQPTVHTDAPSSDFLGLPFPESIFSEKTSFVEAGTSADLLPPVPPGLCEPQTSMDDLSQWSLAQLSTMLSATAPPASGAPDSSFLLGNSLADLGLGLDGAGSADPAGDAQFGSADLGQLVDMPTDAQFSALLESFASGDAADAYSSLGGDSSFGSDGLPGVSAASGTGSRLLGSRVAGSVDVGHGSSSTITLMHDGSSVCEPDTAAVLPAPARPPPGLPGMIRERNGGTKRSSLVGTAHSSLVGPAMSAAMALSLPSNPPSSSGIGDLDVGQMLNFQLDGDVLERELEGLINFDA
ncbi:hypothetical protein EV183_004762 [Coemansia sp. RSA 2336]|nr:hypothetical protein EV183_004762 [Coemansia sp. RSA 2336]